MFLACRVGVVTEEDRAHQLGGKQYDALCCWSLLLVRSQRLIAEAEAVRLSL
jgi:hypothetical protein